MPHVLENHHEEDASNDGTKPEETTQQDKEAQPAANQDHQTASGIQEGQTSTEQCQAMSPPKKVPTVLDKSSAGVCLGLVRELNHRSSKISAMS